MSSQKTSLLLCIEEDDIRKAVEEILSSGELSFVSSRNASQAIPKASNQTFSLFITRSKKPCLSDPNGLFQWCKTKKNYLDTPWIILGHDIENVDTWANQPLLKFTADPRDAEELLKTINALLAVTALRETAQTSHAHRVPRVDLNFINPIVASVSNTLQSMAQIDVKRNAPFLKGPQEKPSILGDISGLIAMNSKMFSGSFAICFPRPTILAIYRKMLGIEDKDIDEDVKDCVAELTNIIFGNAKRELNAFGYEIEPALPTVVVGSNHEVRHAVQGSALCIPFESTAGSLVVECVIGPQKPEPGEAQNG